MRHATDAALNRIEPLLETLRALPQLKERKRGVFYRSSGAFLHFHEDPAGVFADLKIDGTFQRFPLNSARQREQLLRRARHAAAS